MTYTRSHVVLFLGPLLLIVVLMYGMMAWTVAVAMDDWVGMAPVWKFVGWNNFHALLTGTLRQRFLTSLRNNLTWLGVFILPTASLDCSSPTAWTWSAEPSGCCGLYFSIRWPSRSW